MLLFEVAAQVIVASAFVQLNIHKINTPKSLAKRDLDALALHELPLQNAISFYQTELSIGTPPQLITVQLDTGSSDLWIMSSENPFCKKCQCPEKTVFNKRLSKTLRLNNSTPLFNIAYGDYTFASGIYVQDDITLRGFRHGESDSYMSGLEQPEEKHQNEGDFLTIHGANFAIADRGNSSEAVWGIGLMDTESITRNHNAHGEQYPAYENLPVQMKTQGHIDRLAYSLWLNDLHSTVGSILFGAVDRAKYVGDLQRVPMVEGVVRGETPTDFSVMLHGISAFNRENSSQIIIDCSVSVLLDSGTTYSQLPSQMLDAIVRILGAEFEPTNRVYIVSEDRKKELSGGGLRFNLSNIEIEVPIDELLLPIGSLNETPEMDKARLEKSNRDQFLKNYAIWALRKSRTNPDQHGNFYLLGIFPVKDGTSDAYILGDTFLRSAYVTYDLEAKEIALANTNYNATNTQIEKLGPNGLSQHSSAKLYDSTATSSEFQIYAHAVELFPSRCKLYIRSPKGQCKTDQPATSIGSPLQSLSTLTGYLSRAIESSTAPQRMTVHSTNKLRQSHEKYSNSANSLSCFVTELQILIALAIIYV